LSSRRVVVVRLVVRMGCLGWKVVGLSADRGGRLGARCRVLLVAHGMRLALWVAGELVECRLLVELMVVVWLVVGLGLS